MNDSRQDKITWKQFKLLAEKAGVKDNDEIDSIDIAWGNTEDFEINFDDDFGWQIFLQRK
ncbi:MAG: hypothetical protein GXP19_04660 [Gammaproteobacteria bacterium]|nr:hypothetical protein [Gammaproteobacteria bacterium]